MNDFSQRYIIFGCCPDILVRVMNVASMMLDHVIPTMFENCMIIYKPNLTQNALNLDD